MKKTIAILGASGVLLWLGGSYFTGSVAEQETRNLVDQLNQQSQEYGGLNVDQYDRGLFNSKVSFEYSLPSYLVALTEYKEPIKYSCHYDHGMTDIDYACDFLENEAYQQFVEKNFEGQNPIRVTGAISAFGGLTQTVSVDAIDKEIGDGGRFKIGASEISVKSTGEFQKYDLDAKIGAINIRDKEGDIALSDIVSSGHGYKTDLGLFAGTYSILSEQVSIKGRGEGQNFSMQGVSFTGSVTDRNEVMDSVGQLKVELVESDQNDQLTIKDTLLSFDFLGVNSEALVAYQEFTRNLQTDLLANIEQGEEPDMDPNQMMAMLPIVEKMLGKDLNVKVAAQANIGDQPNSFDFNLKLLEKLTFTQLSAFMFDPASVFKKLNIEINSNIHESSLQSNPVALEALKQSPMVVSGDGSYHTSLVLGEKPSLNGKDITIQELQAMLMAGAL